MTVTELLHEGLPISVNEADIDEYRLPRGINGQIELILNNEEVYVFKDTAISYFKFSDISLIQNHTRFFVVFKKEEFNLVILDKIVSPVKLKCEARFHMHSSIKLKSYS